VRAHASAFPLSTATDRLVESNREACFVILAAINKHSSLRLVHMRFVDNNNNNNNNKSAVDKQRAGFFSRSSPPFFLGLCHQTHNPVNPAAPLGPLSFPSSVMVPSQPLHENHITRKSERSCHGQNCGHQPVDRPNQPSEILLRQQSIQANTHHSDSICTGRHSRKILQCRCQCIRVPGRH
jgi:hypothetical protein